MVISLYFEYTKDLKEKTSANCLMYKQSALVSVRHERARYHFAEGCPRMAVTFSCHR